MFGPRQKLTQIVPIFPPGDQEDVIVPGPSDIVKALRRGSRIGQLPAMALRNDLIPVAVDDQQRLVNPPDPVKIRETVARQPVQPGHRERAGERRFQHQRPSARRRVASHTAGPVPTERP